MLGALPAFHAVSGWDSTSSFHGIGKQKMYKVVKSADRFKAALVQMGDTFDLDMDHFPVLQEMIDQCYGIKGCDSIHDARYRKFYTKAKATTHKDELHLHCKRANYVTCIWKSALTATVNPPYPSGYGWLEANGLLEIKWMNQKPAPDSLLGFLACDCKKSGCQNNRCVCVSNGLYCTDLCDCSTCTNGSPDEDDIDIRIELDDDGDH